MNDHRPCPNCLCHDNIRFAGDGDGNLVSYGCNDCHLEIFTKGYDKEAISKWNNLPRGAGIQEKDGKFYVPVENIRALNEERNKINRLDLEKIVFTENGIPLVIPEESLKEFAFCGLCNEDFILSDWLNREEK